MEVVENNQESFYTYEDTQKYVAYKRFESTYKKIGINIIDSEDKLTWLINKLIEVGTYAIDTETTGLDYHSCELVGIGFCWGLSSKQSAYIPVGHKEGEQLNVDRVLQVLKPILEGIQTKKILHNAKYDLNVLRAYGIKMNGLLFDTIVAHYLLRTDHYSQTYKRYSNHKLDIIIADYYPIFPYTYDSLVGKDETLADKCIEDVAYYCAIDCWCTYALYEVLAEQIIENKLTYLFYYIEMGIVPILADMEYRGLNISEQWYSEKKEQIKPKLKQIANRANQYKEGINLNSPIQLSKYLFEELQLPTKNILKTKVSYSINKDTIKQLEGTHPFVDLLAEYKGIIHLYTTFVEGIYKKKNAVTNRLHPNFNNVCTDTGRLSCLNPNTQNFPSEYREGIVPREDYKFISFDYSQCELRILAYLTQEPVLIKAFKNDEDVHIAVARILLNKKEITAEERRACKTLNFGIIYGMQAYKLTTSLNCSIEQAEKLISEYWLKLPRVKEWFEKIYRKAIGNGYTETIMGRRRYYDFKQPLIKAYRGKDYTIVPNLKSIIGDYKLWEEDAEVLRSAGNAPIQGSNADITKLAMIRCNDSLKDYDCKIIFTIHDEIIFECVEVQVDKVVPIIKKEMESIYNLGVPLKVDYRIGNNWKECK